MDLPREVKWACANFCGFWDWGDSGACGYSHCPKCFYRDQDNPKMVLAPETIPEARAADPVIPYPPEKSEERLKAFRVIDDPCDPEHLERLAQTMTNKQRQAFYEHLYYKHGCRIFKC